MKMKYLVGAGMLAALAIGSPAQAQDAAGKKFITEAIQGNLAEVDMGKLAQQNGASDGVKSFGQMLQKDHADANEKAKAAAKTAGVAAPTAPSAKQKADYDRMSKLKGAQFDTEFATHMVADHKKDIAEYEKASQENDTIGKYAKEALPTLNKHLETAQPLQTKPATTESR